MHISIKIKIKMKWRKKSKKKKIQEQGTTKKLDEKISQETQIAII